jgi:Polyketide cyclase / dehydrase and lipid transport
MVERELYSQSPWPKVCDTRGVTTMSFSDSLSVWAKPDDLYALISDITRMGEWSPQCKKCWWDEGDGPHVGSWFTGHNESEEKVWETHCQVVAADVGREFAWEVNNGWVCWRYTFEPDQVGTRLTESWEFRSEGIAGFRELFGAAADDEIEKRRVYAARGIPVTLAAIKRTAEAK